MAHVQSVPFTDVHTGHLVHLLMTKFTPLGPWRALVYSQMLKVQHYPWTSLISAQSAAPALPLPLANISSGVIQIVLRDE